MLSRKRYFLCRPPKARRAANGRPCDTGHRGRKTVRVNADAHSLSAPFLFCSSADRLPTANSQNPSSCPVSHDKSVYTFKSDAIQTRAFTQRSFRKLSVPHAFLQPSWGTHFSENTCCLWYAFICQVPKHSRSRHLFFLLRRSVYTEDELTCFSTCCTAQREHVKRLPVSNDNWTLLACFEIS